jgi:hypothetical protein
VSSDVQVEPPAPTVPSAEQLARLDAQTRSLVATLAACQQALHRAMHALHALLSATAHYRYPAVGLTGAPAPHQVWADGAELVRQWVAARAGDAPVPLAEQPGDPPTRITFPAPTEGSAMFPGPPLARGTPLAEQE